MEGLERLGIGKRTLEKLMSLGIYSIEDLALKKVRDKFALAIFKSSEWQNLVLHARLFLSMTYFDSSKVTVRSDDTIEITNGDILLVYSVLAIMNLTEEDVEIKAFNDNNFMIKPLQYDSQNAKLNEYRIAVFNSGISKIKERIKLPNQRKLDTQMARAEIKLIERYEKVYHDYLKDLISNRLEQTIEFGKNFSLSELIDYLKNITGSLYEDSFLCLTQQVAISDTAIVKDDEKKLSTGFNLAIFGSPGTGKSFASIDLILGNQDENIPPHGLPGLNRYCGGMTAAQFIRIAQAYEGKCFNFIVPEFNEWFKYPGMVEILKQAMERKLLRYETTKFSISPYKFDSYFSVNYNTKITDSGYEVTISDPNYEAIEDRMICRLHVMSKERFVKIIDNLESSLLGTRKRYNANQIRDLITLIYAIQTNNDLVKEYFSSKNVNLDDSFVMELTTLTKKIIQNLDNNLHFSPRLYKRTIQVYSAMALFEYFKKERLIPSEEAKNFCKQMYIQEILVRNNLAYNDEVIKEYADIENSLENHSSIQDSESQFPDFLR